MAAQSAKLTVDRIGQQVWAQYEGTGDFAVFDPNNPDADESGMFHVNLAEWEIEKKTDHADDKSVTVILRRKGVDDQGRTV